MKRLIVLIALCSVLPACAVEPIKPVAKPLVVPSNAAVAAKPKSTGFRFSNPFKKKAPVVSVVKK
jgi:hypothetical protein